jgi:hypothetical protein
MLTVFTSIFSITRRSFSHVYEFQNKSTRFSFQKKSAKCAVSLARYERLSE